MSDKRMALKIIGIVPVTIFAFILWKFVDYNIEKERERIESAYEISVETGEIVEAKAEKRQAFFSFIFGEEDFYETAIKVNGELYYSNEKDIYYICKDSINKYAELEIEKNDVLETKEINRIIEIK